MKNKLALWLPFALIISLSSTLVYSDEKIAPETPHKSVKVGDILIDSLTSYPQNGLSESRIESALKMARAKHADQLSIQALYAIADDLTKVYRDAGYKFHSVFVPPQKLGTDNKLRLEMLEAKIGDVNVTGPDDELNRVLTLLFRRYLHRPLYQPDIDKVVLGIKSKYGVRVFTYYSRGSLRGQVRLNIKAERTSSWLSGINVDNFGSESTGRDRATLSYNSFDLMGNLDALTLGIQTAVDGESSTNGFIQYETPIENLDHTLSFSASNNQFEVGEGFEALGLEGDAALFGVSYQYQLTNTFTDQVRLGLNLDYKRNDYDSLFNDPLLEQDELSQSASLFMSYQHRPIASQWSYGIYFAITGGEYEFENTAETLSYRKAYLNQQFQVGLGDQKNLLFSTLRLSTAGQYTQERLSSFELLPMSGAFGVRNVKAGYFGADRGVLSNLEWWFPNLIPQFWSVRTSPFVYYDAAYGERMDDQDTYGTGVILGGSGLGIQAKFKQQFVLSASTSLSLHEHVADNPDPERMKVLLKLNYLFK